MKMSQLRSIVKITCVMALVLKFSSFVNSIIAELMIPRLNASFAALCKTN